ncbi:MAG: M20/M25/M40 family metallo-hydrolase [Candidatus Kariarchaeaceae archaeon]|jgi:acetylornithine deacetylase/succinyl-diaminopimelate desuccinylase-like protein
MELIDTLREFVSLQSISSDPTKGEDSVKTAEYLISKLKDLGVETRLARNKTEGKNPLVLGRLDVNSSKPTLTLYGHYDVQPASVEDGWQSEPFDLQEKDGYLYGRGATDDKGPITATLFAVKELLAEGELPINIRFIYEGEEESGSEGFEETVLANNDWFVDTDGIMVMDNYWLGEHRPCVTYGLRGMTYVTIELSGPSQDLHSGVEGGVIREPLFDLIQILSKLSSKDGKALIDGFYDKVLPLGSTEESLYDAIEYDLVRYREALGVKALQFDNVKKVLLHKWRYPTISIHGIEGAFSGPGGKTVIPSRVTGKVSMRLVPDQDPKEIGELCKKQVEEIFAQLESPNTLSVEAISTGDWWVGNPDNFLFKAADQAIFDVWKQKPMYTREGGSIPIVPFMEKTFDAPAMLLSIGQSTDQAHSQNERIRIENLVNGKEVLKTMFRLIGSGIKDLQQP